MLFAHAQDERFVQRSVCFAGRSAANGQEGFCLSKSIQAQARVIIPERQHGPEQ
jgi:hypothetical protein